MKSHFVDLYRYNHWANQLILDQLPGDAKPRQWFAHILAAQVIWLNRIQGTTFQQPVWPNEDLETLASKCDESDDNWLRFVQDYPRETFEEVIRYQDTKGNPYETKLVDILVHVVNHGTHHRAQISSWLRQSGQVPPPTDFIFYSRSKI
ncbi:MAG: DinB family protein [Cyclobacteriaceae bacterium]